MTAFTMNSIRILQSALLAAALLLLPAAVYADQPAEASAEPSPAAQIEEVAEKSAFQKRLEEKKRKTDETLKVGTQVPQNSDIAERFVKGIIYCIAVFVGLTYLNNHLRSKREKSGAGAIDLLARRTIGNRMSLLLVEVEGKKFFLSQTSDMVQMLAPLSDPLGLAEGFNEETDSGAAAEADDYELPRAVHE